MTNHSRRLVSPVPQHSLHGHSGLARCNPGSDGGGGRAGVVGNHLCLAAKSSYFPAGLIVSPLSTVTPPIFESPQKVVYICGVFAGSCYGNYTMHIWQVEERPHGMYRPVKLLIHLAYCAWLLSALLVVSLKSHHIRESTDTVFLHIVNNLSAQ